MSGEEYLTLGRPGSTADHEDVQTAVEQRVMVCGNGGRLAEETVLRGVCQVLTCCCDEAGRKEVVHLARAEQDSVDSGDYQDPSPAAASLA